MELEEVLRVLLFVVLMEIRVKMPKTSQLHLPLNISKAQTVVKHLHQTQSQLNLLSKEKSVLVNGSILLMVELASLML